MNEFFQKLKKILKISIMFILKVVILAILDLMIAGAILLDIFIMSPTGLVIEALHHFLWLITDTLLRLLKILVYQIPGELSLLLLFFTKIIIAINDIIHAFYIGVFARIINVVIPTIVKNLKKAKEEVKMWKWK